MEEGGDDGGVGRLGLQREVGALQGVFELGDGFADVASLGVTFQEGEDGSSADFWVLRERWDGGRRGVSHGCGGSGAHGGPSVLHRSCEEQRYLKSLEPTWSQCEADFFPWRGV